MQGLVTQVLKFSPAFTSNAGSSEASHVSIISGSDSSAEMGYYNSKMLQYVHFIQSLSMLERLLLSKKGRDLFPVKVPGRKGLYVCVRESADNSILLWLVPNSPYRIVVITHTCKILPFCLDSPHVHTALYIV